MKVKSTKIYLLKINWKWALAIATSALIGVSFMAYENLLPKLIAEIPFGDKIGHFFLIGSLGLLTHKVMENKKISLAAGPLIITAVSLTDECFQSLSPVRSFSSGDIVANLAGIWFLYLLYEYAKKKWFTKPLENTK